MADIDLTPFGFTPTENAAYGALLELGPASGYALAKALSIARANAYQALNGLASKGAAEATDEQPQRFKPMRPDALLAALVDREARRIDRLEEQIRSIQPPEGDSLVPIRGERSLLDLTLRTIAREKGPVTWLGPSRIAEALNPGWHRRRAAGWETAVWITGEDGAELPIAIAGAVPADRVSHYFGGPVAMAVAGDSVIAASLRGNEVVGYWTTDSVLGGAIKAGLETLVTE